MEERRKYFRYHTELKIDYQVNYDIRTKVKFQVLNIIKHKLGKKKYSGPSKNISVEGLCFVSNKELKKGNILFLEVYEPNTQAPIIMEGEVRWSQEIVQSEESEVKFYTGIKIISVNGQSVIDSISHDKDNDVDWSIVLETVFGNFKEMARRNARNI